jgi:hypothetical protein
VEKIIEQYYSFSQEEKERNSLKWGLLAILPMVSFLIYAWFSYSFKIIIDIESQQI